MDNIFISICIPAYKRTDFLSRLLDSVALQEFTGFEVIVTDDSNSEEVKLLCNRYSNKFNISYYKNDTALGTPENWNQSIRVAKGEWIKLMHDDDWFNDKESLGKFAAAAKEEDVFFIFSGYNNVIAGADKQEENLASSDEKRLLSKDPANLLKTNFIGPPSTTLIRNKLEQWYDKDLKWLVDIEFYIRVLSAHHSYYAIPKALVNIGISDEQVTKTAFRNPAIEIPENIKLLRMIGTAKLKLIFVYDHYWRFIRNLSVRDTSVVKKYYDGEIPALLQHMIKQHRRIPVSLMKWGVISKTTMAFTWLWNRMKGRMK